MTLKTQVANSLKWLIGSSFISKLIFTATTVVLARLLDPSIFGLYALAFVAIDALAMFKSMGFDSALIRRKEDIEKALDTAFFIIPVFGIILFIFLFFSATTIGRFFNNAELPRVLRTLGIIFVFSCFAKVPAALLEKRMQFAKVSLIGITSILVYSISAIVFSLLRFGIWSLVYAYVLRSLINAILTWYFAKWRPRWRFDRTIAWDMFHFGKFIFLGAIVWYLKSNLDNALVGKLLGVTSLGLYAIAFRIANFGADFLGSKVQTIIFPAFSKIQSNDYDLKKAFLKTVKYLSIFAFPFCSLIFFLGGDLLRVLYGQQWVGAIPVLRILAFAGLANTLPLPMGSLLNAKGKSKQGFWFSFLQVALFFIFIAPAARLYGLVGVGIVVTVSQLISTFVYLPYIMKLASLNFKEIYLSLRTGLIIFCVTSLAIVLNKNMFSFKIGSSFYYLNLYLLIFFTFLLYCTTLWFTDKTTLKEMKGFLIKA